MRDDIPCLAEGGIISKPIPMIIGTKEKEVIIPLEKMEEFMLECKDLKVEDVMENLKIRINKHVRKSRNNIL